MAIGASGYAILPGPLADAALAAARQAVVDAIARANSEEVRIGSTTVRVNGILGGVPELAALLDHAPLLAAAGEIIGGPRAARPSVDFPRVLPNEVLHRLSPAARNLL